MDLQLRRGRWTDGLRFDAGVPINWKAVNRRAHRLAAVIAAQSADGPRQGFALRRYTEDAALLEALRCRRAGKHLKRAVRGTGSRLKLSAAVMMAVTPEGRRLHAAAEQLEQRVAAREAIALCG